MTIDLYSSVAAPERAEYLRRNLLVCSAIGAKAEAASALNRLRQTRRPPKWLVEAFEAIIERTEPLPTDLARWRSLAPDRPAYVTPDAAE